MILPAVLFWATALVSARLRTPKGDETILGGSRLLPTIISGWGATYSPNKLGMILLLVALFLYLGVTIWWAVKAELHP